MHSNLACICVWMLFAWRECRRLCTCRSLYPIPHSLPLMSCRSLISANPQRQPVSEPPMACVRSMVLLRYNVDGLYHKKQVSPPLILSLPCRLAPSSQSLPVVGMLTAGTRVLPFPHSPVGYIDLCCHSHFYTSPFTHSFIPPPLALNTRA